MSQIREGVSAAEIAARDATVAPPVTNTGVFNKTTGCVEIMVDVTFDKSNGSQVEHVNKNLVDMEEPPSVSIMRMGLGEVRPRHSSSS